MTIQNGWLVVLASGAGCYALKLAGYVMPARWFEHPRLRELIQLMPVALLSALIVVQTVASGSHYDFNGPRLAGVGVAAVAVWRRAPFIVVVVLAAATAALLRLA
jgi:branched-subunit amino acid transport protein